MTFAWHGPLWTIITKLIDLRGFKLAYMSLRLQYKITADCLSNSIGAVLCHCSLKAWGLWYEWNIGVYTSGMQCYIIVCLKHSRHLRGTWKKIISYTYLGHCRHFPNFSLFCHQCQHKADSAPVCSQSALLFSCSSSFFTLHDIKWRLVSWGERRSNWFNF